MYVLVVPGLPADAGTLGDADHGLVADLGNVGVGRGLADVEGAARCHAQVAQLARRGAVGHRADHHEREGRARRQRS